MGYIMSGVQTGVGYAEKYQLPLVGTNLPGLINKVRCSSTLADKFVSKTDTLLREQGTPLVQKIDGTLDEKLPVAVKYAQGKYALVAEPVAKVTEKVQTAKQYACVSVEASKQFASKKVEDVKQTSTAKLSLVQSKAEKFKGLAEEKLTAGAKKADEKLGCSYATDVTTFGLKNANSALAYSYATAQTLASTVTALPDLLKARTEKALAFTTETTSRTKAYVASAHSKVMVVLLAVKVQLLAVPSTFTETKTKFTASLQKGTLYQDATKMCTPLYDLAQENYCFLTKRATAYVAVGKEKVTETVAKAKGEFGKLQPFLMQTKGQALALFSQAKQTADAFLKKTKAA